MKAILSARRILERAMRDHHAGGGMSTSKPHCRLRQSHLVPIVVLPCARLRRRRRPRLRSRQAARIGGRAHTAGPVTRSASSRTSAAAGTPGPHFSPGRLSASKSSAKARYFARPRRSGNDETEAIPSESAPSREVARASPGVPRRLGATRRCSRRLPCSSRPAKTRRRSSGTAW